MHPKNSEGVGGELLFFKENQRFTRQMNRRDILAAWVPESSKNESGAGIYRIIQ